MRKLLLASFFVLSACRPATGPEPSPLSPHLSSSPSVPSSIDLRAQRLTVNGFERTVSLPREFTAEVFAANLPGARTIVQDGQGNFWVSQPGEGTVSRLEVDPEIGSVRAAPPVFKSLQRPHGLAVDPKRGMTLYIAEEHRIVRAPLYSDGTIEEVAALPEGGNHWTRSVGFGPDGRLYVSAGSTCNACIEGDDRRAAMFSMLPDGTDERIVATGLRNSVFFTWNPVDASLWATDMGRDHLGDSLPPEEVNVIRSGGHYGWPFCYGARVRDEDFQGWRPFDCATTVPPRIQLPAHTAPLGLAFIPEEGWPEEYWYDLIVALHGSWNSSVKVGYKLVRIPLDARGNVEGPAEDFMTGFLAGGDAWGRPVDVKAMPGGALYVTDDRAGVVYRVYKNTPSAKKSRWSIEIWKSKLQALAMTSLGSIDGRESLSDEVVFKATGEKPPEPVDPATAEDIERLFSSLSLIDDEEGLDS